MALIIKPRHAFTFWGLLAYLILLALMLTLFLVRADTGLWRHVPFVYSHRLYGHISNFSLSIILLWATGTANLLTYASWRYLWLMAGVMMLANIVMETLISLGNTIDILDAMAGIIGSLLALGGLRLLQRYGMRPVGRQ